MKHTHARNERHGKNLADPSLSIGDIIALSREHDRFQDATRFTTSEMPGNRPPKQQSDFSQGPIPHGEYPKCASEGSYKRKREADKEHSTRGPKGNPYMEKDFCHRNQRNSRSHGLACKYVHDATEMATIRACSEANMWVQSPDSRSGKAQKTLGDQRSGGNARGRN